MRTPYHSATGIRPRRTLVLGPERCLYVPSWRPLCLIPRSIRFQKAKIMGIWICLSRLLSPPHRSTNVARPTKRARKVLLKNLSEWSSRDQQQGFGPREREWWSSRKPLQSSRFVSRSARSPVRHKKDPKIQNTMKDPKVL